MTIVVDDSASSALLANAPATGTSGSLGALEVSVPAEPAEPVSAPVADVASELLSEALSEPSASSPQVLPAAALQPRKPKRPSGAKVGAVVVAVGAMLGALLTRLPAASSPRNVAVAAPSTTRVAVAEQLAPAASLEASAQASASEPTVAAQPAGSANIEANAVPAQAADTTVPYDQRALGFALRWAVEQAHVCHRKGGGPAGQIRVELVFEPTGKVSQANVSGVSVPGSAEERCIATQFRALRIPAFSSESFRVSREITLR